MRTTITTFFLYLFSFQVYAQLTGTVINASMETCADGQISLSVAGGYEPYTFNWTGSNNFSSTLQNITNIKAGIYKVEVTDALCGKANKEFIVKSEFDPVITYFENVKTCWGNGDSGDGLIVIGNKTGGFLSGLSFAWSGPNGFTGSNSSENLLHPGDYTITVTSSTGCTKVLNRFLCCCEALPEGPQTPSNLKCYSGNQSGWIGIKEEVTPPSSETAKDGAINITIIGKASSQGLIIEWSGPNGFYSTNEDISNIGVGEYCVEITDGCVSTTKCFKLVDCSSVSINIDVESHPVCGKYKGSLKALPTGGELPYKYKWNNGSFAQSLTELDAGNYCVTVLDKTYCKAIKCSSVKNGKLTHDKNCKVYCDGEERANLGPPYAVTNKEDCAAVDYKCSDGHLLQTNVHVGLSTEYVHNKTDCYAVQRNKVTDEICGPYYYGEYIEEVEWDWNAPLVCGEDGDYSCKKVTYCVLTSPYNNKTSVDMIDAPKNNIVMFDPLYPGDYCKATFIYTCDGQEVTRCKRNCAGQEPIIFPLTGGGISTVSNTQDLSVLLWPNFSSEQINIVLSQEEIIPVKISIFTIDGVFIEAINLVLDNSLVIPLNIKYYNLGMYIVQIQSESVLKSLKFLKQ